MTWSFAINYVFRSPLIKCIKLNVYDRLLNPIIMKKGIKGNHPLQEIKKIQHTNLEYQQITLSLFRDLLNCLHNRTVK